MSFPKNGNKSYDYCSGMRVAASTLADNGATVLCNDIRPEQAEAAATFARANGGRASALPFDIGDPDAVAAASREHGPITILVNSAGIAINNR